MKQTKKQQLFRECLVFPSKNTQKGVVVFDNKRDDGDDHGDIAKHVMENKWNSWDDYYPLIFGYTLLWTAE